jgi:hypothetical protein
MFDRDKCSLEELLSPAGFVVVANQGLLSAPLNATYASVAAIASATNIRILALCMASQLQMSFFEPTLQ